VPDAGTIGLVALGLVIGAVSAVTPFLPVEAYVVGLAVTHPSAVAVAGAVAAAIGQTAGKLALFSAARGAAGSGWLRRLRDRGAKEAAEVSARAAETGTDPAGGPVRRALRRVGRWLRTANAAGIALLSGRWGPVVVLVSGALGIPPMLAIAFYAGTSKMGVRPFLIACLAGRTIRFVVLALVPELVPDLF
jgi:membrane protein YqaA with SNARE-associated domain